MRLYLPHLGRSRRQGFVFDRDGITLLKQKIREMEKSIVRSNRPQTPMRPPSRRAHRARTEKSGARDSISEGVRRH